MRAVGGAPIIEISLDIEGARWLALPEAPDQPNSYPLSEIRLSKLDVYRCSPPSAPSIYQDDRKTRPKHRKRRGFADSDGDGILKAVALSQERDHPRCRGDGLDDSAGDLRVIACEVEPLASAGVECALTRHPRRRYFVVPEAELHGASGVDMVPGAHGLREDFL